MSPLGRFRPVWVESGHKEAGFEAERSEWLWSRTYLERSDDFLEPRADLRGDVQCVNYLESFGQECQRTFDALIS